MGINKNHAVLINENNEAFGAGENNLGQLGVGSLDEQLVLSLVRIPAKLIAVSAGFSGHTLGVADDGTLWGFGDNLSGQLGLGSAMKLCRWPMRVLFSNSKRFRAVSAGEKFSLALDHDGELWCMGCNQEGQLGLAHASTVFQLTPNPHLKNLVMIAAGFEHSLVLDAFGLVFAFGSNEFGQLGLADYESRDVPRQLKTKQKVRMIAVGCDHSVLLDELGHVWSFGHNGHGQLGVGDYNHRIAPVVIPSIQEVSEIWCGGASTYAQDARGWFWVCGHNQYGQLCLDQLHDRLTPVRNPTLEASARKLYPGGEHLMFVDEGGTVFVCGRNEAGQLGLGHKENQLTLCVIPEFTLGAKRISPVKNATSRV